MQSKEKTEDIFKISGSWETRAKELKNEFSQLTDEDLILESGKENELIKRIESRLNKNHEEVISIIEKSQPKAV